MIALEKIKEKDYELYSALTDVIEYLATTYDDKYASDDKIMDTKDFLYHKDFGKGANMFTASKYIQRYCTKGYSKSEKVIDLYKSIHYSIFELVRKKYYDNTTINTNHQDKRTEIVPTK
jgi:hypothetical protein